MMGRRGAALRLDAAVADGVADGGFETQLLGQEDTAVSAPISTHVRSFVVKDRGCAAASGFLIEIV